MLVGSAPCPTRFRTNFAVNRSGFTNFFWMYEWYYVNNFMTNNERKAFRRRIFFKYQEENDFE